MESLTKQTHPLILVAAVSVSIASLAAAAHFTGLISPRSPEPTAPLSAPPAPTASLPAPVAALPPATAEIPAPPKPAAKPRVQRAAPSAQASRGEDEWGGRTRKLAHHEDAGIDVIPARPAPITDQGPASAQPPAAVPQAPVCHDCGTVEAVREIETKGEGTGLGAIAGGVIGGLLGNQVGGGRGRSLATVAGAVGGAYAGHQVEKNVRGEKQLEVTVRFDDGSVRRYTQTGTWHNGDRVRLNNGAIVAL
ncbi:MAG: glycine zipper 2TM domain-containing protein [Betaproteobacteria bacterium]|jgi:outer membrane lipoprotein SlyB|nr:glycine zipper 2TM domain-containing protein [Betaproteobacteria bacterium]HMV22054.1 glycine zipper 2TM domain-containing protein [Rhodocyclaceae bacterium]HNE44047.1 glycine zipper 2TM domain-containing protein [Rhodocyclaceae bacterium]HNM22476.1 glycine zipper 2TM domain-containing protein [Rhodocyclaceae bacterium]HNM82525.1 glycine zipper 2TM domain-containing protein [Rhodocyclaceae bacterium]